jgi:hypothetical protein
MDSDMLALRHHREVLPYILGLVPVDVVNDLIGGERSAEVPLRNDPVLKDVPAPIGFGVVGLLDSHVACGVDVEATTPASVKVGRKRALKRRFARNRAVAALRNVAGFDEERQTALEASTLNGHRALLSLGVSPSVGSTTGGFSLPAIIAGRA